MAFNGSGVFSLVAGNPVVSGTVISSTTHNNTMTDIATNVELVLLLLLLIMLKRNKLLMAI